jgi:hypothetical protein
MGGVFQQLATSYEGAVIRKGNRKYKFHGLPNDESARAIRDPLCQGSCRV